MHLFDEALEDYIQAHSTPESSGLFELNRETNLKVSKPQMLSGHVQGQVLSMLSFMVRPDHILEIGTYTGYATICLARGLAHNGVIHTIDNNEELENLARYYWRQEGIEPYVDFYTEDASTVIPRLSWEFELVFIDADKENYAHYYDQVFDKVPNGGFIIADNVLWSGKVLNNNPDKDTAALQAFNEKVHQDNRVENVILSVRDGLMVIRKL